MRVAVLVPEDGLARCRYPCDDDISHIISKKQATLGIKFNKLLLQTVTKCPFISYLFYVKRLVTVIEYIWCKENVGKIKMNMCRRANISIRLTGFHPLEDLSVS